MSKNQNRKLAVDLTRATAGFAAGVALLYAVEGGVEYRYVLLIFAVFLISLVYRNFSARESFRWMKFSDLTLGTSILILLSIFGSLALVLVALCLFTG